MGIIIACLPAARLLILRYLPGKIAAWHSAHSAQRTEHSSSTARSSKVGSISTWVSGLSGKRESHNTQAPSLPLSDASHFDNKDRAGSAQVSVAGTGGPGAVQHTGAGSSVGSTLERRESERPLVPGFESSQPAAAAQSSSALVETPPVPMPSAKDRRIWVEQHIYVSNDPVTGVSTETSRGSEGSEEDSTPPWIMKPPGAEDA